MQTLYPEISAYETRQLEVGTPLQGSDYAGQRHCLAIEQYGNPLGIPVIVLHGGPGAGCPPTYARFFDPAIYRIVLYDQRGAGQSLPKSCIEQNTAHDLVADLELIRTTLALEKPLLMGGSWGATLGLLYAQAYPTNVSGLILCSTWLGEHADCSTFLREGSVAALKNPDEWHVLKHFLFADEAGELKTHEEIMHAFYVKAQSNKPATWQSAAATLNRWEALNSYNEPQAIAEGIERSNSIDGMTIGRIEIHYLTHKAWLADGQIIQQISKLSHLPVYMVHGQQDLVCAATQAEKLYQALVDVQADVVIHRTMAGHSGGEPQNMAALIACGQAFARRARD